MVDLTKEGFSKLKTLQYNNVQAPKPKCYYLVKQVTYLSLVLVIGYTCAGALGLQALTGVDKFISPVVDSLRFIGFGVLKPSIDGPMPDRFYTNLVGLAIWSALAYNAAVVVFLICSKSTRSEVGFDAARRRAVDQRGWSPARAWYVLHAIVYFGVLPLAVFWAAALLNGSHGWFVFHANSIVAVAFTALVFIFPGAFVSLLGYAIIRFIVYDLSQLFLLFSRSQK